MNARNRRIIAAADKYAEIAAEYERLHNERERLRVEADAGVNAARAAEAACRDYERTLNGALAEVCIAIIPDVPSSVLR